MNTFRRILLWWRLKRVDVNTWTKDKRFPLGYTIVKDGRRYMYCKYVGRK